MTLTELKEAIRLKTMELEAAQQAGLPHDDLMTIYKKLKELQYYKLRAELEPKEPAQ